MPFIQRIRFTGRTPSERALSVAERNGEKSCECRSTVFCGARARRKRVGENRRPVRFIRPRRARRCSRAARSRPVVNGLHVQPEAAPRRGRARSGRRAREYRSTVARSCWKRACQNALSPGYSARSGTAAAIARRAPDRCGRLDLRLQPPVLFDRQPRSSRCRACAPACAAGLAACAAAAGAGCAAAPAPPGSACGDAAAPVVAARTPGRVRRHRGRRRPKVPPRAGKEATPRAARARPRASAPSAGAPAPPLARSHAGPVGISGIPSGFARSMRCHPCARAARQAARRPPWALRRRRPIGHLGASGADEALLLSQDGPAAGTAGLEGGGGERAALLRASGAGWPRATRDRRSPRDVGSGAVFEARRPRQRRMVGVSPPATPAPCP